MSDAAKAVSDLEFVKGVVERREREARGGVSPRWLGVMWGVIALVGCVWNDLHPWTCWLFWAVVPPVAFGATCWMGGRQAFMMGEYDAETGRRMGLHWSVCFLGGVPVVLMAFAGKIDGYTMGQLLLLVSGIVYYLGGVHFDRRWMLPGVVLMVGAAVLTFVHNWAWSAVGAMVCLSLVISFWRDPAAKRRVE